MCVCVFVIVCDVETSVRGGLDSVWAAEPQKKAIDMSVTPF